MRAIEIHNLSKLYRLRGAAESTYTTARDAVNRIAGSVFRRTTKHIREDNNSLWALRDVSFDVEEGEALGIIGRNGAGKSTLLKILSRITEPTSGRARLYGRVASLLEVGTGFHPELTGRENVYLNGTILGMKRAEINRHFHEIVAFAEVEKFLDTPVKFYSSGMYVRLAFAVAAFLTPEILIIDEVLAVGDFEFQRRCLGRMQSVAKSGRTVLFVSHNMASMEELCSRSLLLRKGQVEGIGSTAEIVAQYLSSRTGQAAWKFDDFVEREGTGNALITHLELLDPEDSQSLTEVFFRRPFRIRIHYHASKRLFDPRFGLALLTERGERVFLTETTETNYEIGSIDGSGWVDCTVTAPNVLPGTYFLELWIAEIANVTAADHLHMVGRIDISLDPSIAGNQALLTYHDRGRVFMDCQWSLDNKVLQHAT